MTEIGSIRMRPLGALSSTLAKLGGSQRIVLAALILNAACSSGSSSPQSGGGAGQAGAPSAGAGDASGGGGGAAAGGQQSAGGVSGSTGLAGAGGAVAGSAGQFGTAGAGSSLTPQQAVTLMAPGWNLGNSFDATPNETSWGNPTPSQALINAVHSAGFKTLRLPVTWSDHIGAAPTYTIDSAWMNKVKQTAQWAVDAGMYVFVNTHHEADGNAGWVSFPQSTSDAMKVADEVTAVWTQ
ncbi:MAG TPA: cellulase family glycosylhydrolase, partial [Polyangiaceae bacterium]